MVGASPIEKTILGAALKKCNIRTVFPNIIEAQYVRLSLEEPSGFRSKMIERPLRGQTSASMVNLVQMLLPEHYEAEDLRACIHKVFALKDKDASPLVFYKEYFF